MNMTEDGELVRRFQFSWFEYLVFFGMLSFSALIGVYYAVCRKSKTVEEYMLGDRQMPLIPVALSLAASFVSGISLLGIPAETYMYGTQLYNICFAISMCYFLMVYFYLPVIYNLQAKSLFEYLELRFDKSVRTLASFVFVLAVVKIVPVVIYVPALAFNQVTGVSVYVLAPLICGVCIFYTALGGLRAVVWSDAVQSGCVLTALIAVSVIGLRQVGGLEALLQVNGNNDRLEFFNMDPDPTARNTFWTTTVGSLPTWLMAVAANPSTAQRYVSLGSYRQAKISVLIMVAGIVVLKSLSTFVGLIIYAKYHDCDPVLTKEVEKPGQLLPLFTMEVTQDYPGLGGLFMAGVVCTALSTMSTMLNTIAGTIYEDFVKSRLSKPQSERSANCTIQLLTIAMGAITTCLVFVVQRLGTIMQVAVSLQGISNGVLLFMFTFGMFVPWGNSKGVKWGTLAGLVSTSVLMIGGQYYVQTGQVYFANKILSVANCTSPVPANIDERLLGFRGEGTKVFFEDSVPFLFRLSYLYYSPVGLGMGMLTAMVVSLLTGPQDPDKLDQRLVIPMLRRQIHQPPHEMYTPVPAVLVNKA